MITVSCANRSRIFKVIRGFLFAAVFIAGALFCKPCFAEESAADKEYKAQKKFLQLQSSIDNEDYMMAQFVLSSFQKDFAKTEFYKKYSKKTNELAKEIKKATKNIKVEDKIEYLFVPPRLETKLWQGYMSQAEMMLSQRQGRMGIAVLRVIFEDENLEAPSIMSDRSSYNQMYNSQINIYQCGGGYSPVGTTRSGDAVFVGSEFWNWRGNDSSEKDASVIGDIVISGLYHYPTKLKIEVQRGKAIAFGEVIVRSIPEKYRGNLKVKVETEGGEKLTDASAILYVQNSRFGKSEPVKENSCLFSSVGPGSYSAELASNNTFGSVRQSAEVVLGQTTEVTINAYRHREIEFDWRFRKSNEPNNWVSGQKTIKTKETWQPENEWPGVQYPVIAFGDWTDNTCKMRSYNGNLMYVDSNEPFEKMKFPLNFGALSYNGRDIKEGDVFAWRQDDQKEVFFEALIRIRKITPVRLPSRE